ncbi:YihY/virulence factor BrkB family protein [Pontibacter sp. BT310]|uniref:YihY/virulence factor BrkB family protein n=1 Tax=Pontibacter populi TaxID=890055 RepID=A0ABS6X8V4_9BACT|nr:MULTISPECIES: YihY/virulence factor BrkB family protein [Pontibacter]MBJ6117571.1 YihY/virulence factor BrkB family protein [Pontibacter sp. BT310]MBR0569996.1 YihY/virulence factor BrkB family protein [Microvirga sp. STS03]MBW3364424.1 YihY/virulence factor BrkB family protein [Pontibacter populi]
MVRSRLLMIWLLLEETWLEFLDNNSFQKGAALAYYTIFALPPMLIIIISASGYFLEEKAVSGEIYYRIKELIGSEGAYAVQKMVENVNAFTNLNLAAIVGGGALFIAATGLFVSMQDSLNEIWYVKPKPKRGYLKLILDRALSFGMILVIAIILLLSLLANTVLVIIGDFLTARFSGWIVYVLHLANFMSSLVMMSFLFGCIYKFLPDAKIKWRDVWVGAIVTALLFSLFRGIIGFYLGKNEVGSVYGAAGSVVIILTWVFFTSQIIFFGAVFTFVYSRKYGHNIYPATYAVRVIRQEIEVGNSAVNAEPGKHEREVYGSEEEPIVPPEETEKEQGANI